MFGKQTSKTGKNYKNMSRRRNTRRVATLLRNYRQDSDSNSDNEDDDVRLALINLMQAAISQSSRKSLKSKRTHNRTQKSNTNKSPATATNRISKSKKKVTVNTSETICLDSDANHNESITTVAISDTQKDAYVKNVQHKVDSFFKSGHLMSDDDDDEDDSSAQTKFPKKSTVDSKNFYAISDSDEELPSTSRVNNLVEPIGVAESANNKEEDLMEIVDKILDCDDTPVEINTNDVESDNWNEFKSKAEEIMGSVTALLDTFKDDKDKGKVPPEISPSKTKPSCPICLEVLDGNIVPGATICGHIFCMACIKKAVKTSKTCPTCRKRITVKQIHPLYL